MHEKLPEEANVAENALQVEESATTLQNGGKLEEDEMGTGAPQSINFDNIKDSSLNEESEDSIENVAKIATSPELEEDPVMVHPDVVCPSSLEEFVRDRNENVCTSMNKYKHCEDIILDLPLAAKSANDEGCDAYIISVEGLTTWCKRKYTIRQLYFGSCPHVRKRMIRRNRQFMFK